MSRTYRQLLAEEFRDVWPEFDLGDRLAIRTLWARPRKRRELEEFLFNHAQAEEIIPKDAKIDDLSPAVVGAPDWEKFFGALGDLFIKIAPLILQLLPYLLKRP